MLGRIAKFLLVASSVAPILLTWVFADWRSQGPLGRQGLVLAAAGALILLCVTVLVGAGRHLGHSTVSVSSIKTADTEVVGFMVAYLLPLVTTGTNDLDYLVLVFVVALIALIVWSTNAYSVNPLLSLLGFHFYEVANSEGVSFLLISRRDLTRKSDVTMVQQLTRYVLLDPKGSNG